jgi:ribosomal protein S18 acetylase RimI-like enzyme
MSTPTQFRIVKVASLLDLGHVAQLFRDYAASLDVDLAYQDFEAELASLPGKYAPPAGALFLARHAKGDALGCVALRPLDDRGACEMKRLYVAAGARGMSLGRALAEAAIAEARLLGYSEMRLDSLPSMTAAKDLYRRLGFVEMQSYYASPIRGTTFMRLQL